MRKTKLGIGARLALALVVLLVGCAGVRVPSATPDMQGASVASSTENAGSWTLLLEVDIDAAKQAGIQDAGDGYDAASARVDSKTAILRKTETGVEEATIDDVLAARFLNVWFTGPVAESYPVQATAGTILILE